MSTFEERIAKAVTDKLNDGTVEELVSDAVTKALKSSIEEQFGWNGDARKVIDEKVKEVMTPAIERVSLDDYVVKLDAILTEIINSTNLVDNKEILGNFKSLMTEPDKDVISLKDVFEKYKEYVSKNVDTSKLKICTGDGPSYQNVEVRVSVDIRNSMFGGRFCDLVFKCVEDEKLTKKIHLYESRSNRFRITGFKSELDINSLRYVDEFDIFMMRLDRAFCNITDEVLGADGYISNDGKHAFKLGGIEEGVGAYFISMNEIWNKTTASTVEYYVRPKGVAWSATASGWKKVVTVDMIDSNDCWIGDIDIDLETGVDYLKTVGTGDSVGVGDRLYKGGTGTGYRGGLKRGHLWSGSFGGFCFSALWFEVSWTSWNCAFCV